MSKTIKHKEVISEVRSKKEIVEMQKRLSEDWNKVEGNVSQWIALTYTQNTLDYVLGKLKEPPVLSLLSFLIREKEYDSV